MLASAAVPASGASSTARRRGSRVTCREYSMTIASRFYFSQFYRPVYLLTVAASVICVAWTAWNHWRIPTSLGFVALEIAVSAFLVFEVVLRMLAFRRRFWSKWWNVIDFVALGMSLLSVVMYFNEEGVLQELEEVAADAVVVLRNALQYMRLAIFLKNRKEHIGSTEGTDIDFDQLTLEDDSFDEDDDEELGLVSRTSDALEEDISDEKEDASATTDEKAADVGLARFS